MPAESQALSLNVFTPLLLFGQVVEIITVAYDVGAIYFQDVLQFSLVEDIDAVSICFG